MHPLRWVEDFIKTFVSQLNERTHTVLFYNDNSIIGWRQKKGRESMHMKHSCCGPLGTW